MIHPSDEILYDLAGKISAQENLPEQEAEYMEHIAGCDDCYRMICCLIAMRDTARHIGSYSGGVSPAELHLPLRERICAVIRLAVHAAGAVLDQIEDEKKDWTFRAAPLALGGVRSAGKRAANSVKKLTDTGNGRTFVAYDPGERMLLIQIDGADCEAEPRAFILRRDAEKTEVPLEKRGHLFQAEVRDLEKGEYELILEKETDLG